MVMAKVIIVTVPIIIVMVSMVSIYHVCVSFLLIFFCS